MLNLIRHFAARWRVADRRRYQRYELPGIRLKIAGKRYETVDWSMGGFKIARCHLTLASGDDVSGKITLEDGESGEFVAEVVAVREDGEVAFRLLEITPRVFLAMGGIREV